MRTNEHKAWLIDLDGTLYDARWVKLMMASELVLLGIGAIATLRRFREEHERLRVEQVEAVSSPWDLQIERTARALGVEAVAVEAHAREWMVERPGKWIRIFRRRALLDEIATYRAAGGRTALVSDYPARKKLDALGAAQLFDQVVASGEAGGARRLKPAPDAFLLAAERLGFAPEACLVLGDREDADGLAARAAGMGFRKIG